MMVNYEVNSLALSEQQSLTNKNTNYFNYFTNYFKILITLITATITANFQVSPP